jgi:serine/threonine protein kinase
MRGKELESKVEIGDFRIEGRLGAGGMGIVYRARQLSLDRVVALKVLGCALSEDGHIARFRRAALAAARLIHPGIARIYYIGQDHELCYMAMELVEGLSLQEVISRLIRTQDARASIDAIACSTMRGQQGHPLRFDEPTGVDNDLATCEEGEPVLPPLAPDTALLIATREHIRRSCEIVRDATRALEYAHQQGVTHRDIKPGNLMLDRQGRVHIIDFGIARFFEDATITQTGQLVGTPLYMSPEQVLGRFDVDHRTDVYSLGVVLHELLTLTPPFLAPTREELLRLIATKNPRPVQWANPGIPEALANIVHRAIAKDRDERYACAADLAEDLERFLGGKPVLAPPYRYRVDEREIAAQRPAWVVTVAALFIGLAIISMAVGGYLLVLFVLAGAAEGNGEGAAVGAIGAAVGLLPLGIGIVMYMTGHGLLACRRWARRVVTACALLAIPGALASAIWAAVVVFEGPYQRGPDLIFGATVVGFLLLVGGACVALIRQLFRPQTQDWFDFAERLRSRRQTSPRAVRGRKGMPRR